MSAAFACQSQLENPQYLLPDVSPQQLSGLSDAAEFEPAGPVMQTVARRLGKVHPSSLIVEESCEFPGEDPQQAVPFHVYQIAGIVSSAERFSTAEAAGDDETGDPPTEYWIAELESSGRRYRVLGLDGFAGPAAAPSGNRRCTAAAIFLALVQIGDQKIPLLATRRLAWHPDSAGDGVSAGEAALGRADVDIGLLREAPERNGRNLDHDDTLAILQILLNIDAALENQPAPLPPLDVVPLLQAPREQTGQAFQVYGALDRVTTVDLQGNRLARRFGVSRYFQLDVHVPLGERELHVRSGRTEKTLSFDESYPVTILVPTLPEGIHPGPRQSMLIELPAVVYRMWSYASVKSRRLDPALRQVVPLLVGDQIRVIAPSAQTFSRLTTGLVIGSLLGLLALAWWLGRPGRRRVGVATGRRGAPPDFSGVAPDFSPWGDRAQPTGENEEKT